MNKVDIKGKGTMELVDGVLHMRWKPGAYIGIDVARAGIDAVSTLARNDRLPMLVEIQGVTHSAAARKVFPSTSNISRMAILGSSPVDRAIAMFRLTLLPTTFPMRYFTSRDKAMTWLRQSSGEPAAEMDSNP